MKNIIANEANNIDAMQADEELKELRKKIYPYLAKYKYTYNFNWLGRPIIQLTEDMVLMQEIIFQVKPDLIIETGIAHGGSLVFSASMLELLGGDGKVIGVDVDIREHNRVAIEAHPMSKRISMIEGSSIDMSVAEQVYSFAKNSKRVMVFLDSNHTHQHVIKELELYSPLVKKGSYLVVFDTGIEDVSEDMFEDRPWGKGDNPKTAVWEFLETNDRFDIDRELESRVLFTVAPDGYLKCVKD
jgi:cephalosporin hydroxylase